MFNFLLQAREFIDVFSAESASKVPDENKQDIAVMGDLSEIFRAVGATFFYKVIQVKLFSIIKKILPLVNVVNKIDEHNKAGDS